MPERRAALRLGRIAGVPVSVKPGWLVMWLLVTWSLAIGLFPRWHPEWSPTLSWAVATLGALLFFVSLLLHELAHAVTARRCGVPVRGITLFLIGGVAHLEHEPATARDELLIVAAGPLTSFALAALGAVAAQAGPVSPLPDLNAMATLRGLGPLASMLFWLASVNLMLGLFNLVPAFPLDGGRLLRAALWALTGDPLKATRAATRGGQLFAFGFVAAGTMMVFGSHVPVLGGGIVNGIWLSVLGWFLNAAASTSRRQLALRTLLSEVPVARLMRADVPTVTPDMRLADLVRDGFLAHAEQAFPVVEGARLLGVVSLEDVRRLSPAAWETTRASEVMTPLAGLATVTPEQDAAAALEALQRRHAHAMPVVRDGRLTGMLRRRDVMRWLQLRSEAA